MRWRTQASSHLATSGGIVTLPVAQARGSRARDQILSGHNRVSAARQAGIEVVPAWVREMDDEAAYMALVLSNVAKRAASYGAGQACAEKCARDKSLCCSRWSSRTICW